MFKSFLVSNSNYASLLEIPCIKPTYYIPNKLLAFSKAISCKDYNQWIHFYEDDSKFERVWNNPKKYLKILKRYNGVILPDFSLYTDMPLIMQIWNIYRSRALGHWFQENGIKVIPNIRFGDKRTYKLCCEGIDKHCVIAVGSNGCMKQKDDKKCFLAGLDYVVKRLEPVAIVVYGSVSKKYFQKYINEGIKIIIFENDITAYHRSK